MLFLYNIYIHAYIVYIYIHIFNEKKPIIYFLLPVGNDSAKIVKVNSQQQNEKTHRTYSIYTRTSYVCM